MSTQINVTVGSGGLSDRAKQQQQAARQAQLEKERTLNLSAEALDKRVAAQAAKGLSLNGAPLYGTDFKQPQIERRPAANRKVANDFFLLRPGGPIDPSTKQILAVKSKAWPTAYIQPPRSEIEFLYEPTSGPNNAPALALNLNAATTAYLYTLHPWPGKREAYRTSILNATLELFFYIGNTLPLPTPSIPGSRVDRSQQEIRFEFGNLDRMELYIYTQAYYTGFPPRLNYYTYIGAYINGFEIANDVFALNPSDIGAGYRVIEPWSSNPLQGQTWTHMALVKEERTVTLYLNGVVYRQVTVDFDFLLFRDLPLDPNITYNGGSFAIMSSGDNITLPSKVHGLRFSPKPVYTEPFTPPENL